MLSVDRQPVAIDLFAGAGGLSLGFEQAGFNVVAAVEADPIHASVHKFNFPKGVVLMGDVSTYHGPQLLSQVNESLLKKGLKTISQVDALIGGPPCQGFSTGGVRDSQDERNNLLLEFVRLVEELRPLTFCFENVSGLLEARFQSIREQVADRLDNAGYAISGLDQVENCIEFGIPQSRRRVIVLGVLGRTPPQRPTPVPERPTVNDAFEGLPKLAGYPELRHTDEVYLSESDLLLRDRSTGSFARYLSGIDRRETDFSVTRIWDPAKLTNSKLTRHRSATIRKFAATQQGETEPTSRLYRLPMDGTSRTLRAGTGADRGSHTSPRPIHPTENRVITVREAARLHGFPDWFRFHSTNWHGHRQVGNSVPPPLARAAGAALMETLGAKPRFFAGEQCLGDVQLLRFSNSAATQNMHLDL